NGANRLSGNAITEALVFGARAGESAASYSRKDAGLRKESARAGQGHFAPYVERLTSGKASDFNAAERIEKLQATMQQDVGPFRTKQGLERALETIGALRRELEGAKPPAGRPFDTALTDWLDLD